MTIAQSGAGVFEQNTAALLHSIQTMVPPPPDEAALHRLMRCALSIALAAYDGDIDAAALTAALTETGIAQSVISSAETWVKLRGQSSAFEPGSTQRIREDGTFLVVEREALDRSERALIVHHVGAGSVDYTLPAGQWLDLECGCPISPDQFRSMEWLACAWIVER